MMTGAMTRQPSKDDVSMNESARSAITKTALSKLNSQQKNSLNTLQPDYEEAFTHRSASMVSGRKQRSTRAEKE